MIGSRGRGSLEIGIEHVRHDTCRRFLMKIHRNYRIEIMIGRWQPWSSTQRLPFVEVYTGPVLQKRDISYLTPNDK